MIFVSSPAYIWLACEGLCNSEGFKGSHCSNICCPRDCVSRHNGGTSGAPLKPLRVDSARGDSCVERAVVGVSICDKSEGFVLCFL